MNPAVTPTETDRLAQILETKRAEIAALRPRAGELRERAAAAAPVRGFAAALRGDAVRLLAEIKRRSPSAGPIRPDADPVEVALAYRAGGAAALSVLTDREYFGGSLEVLEAVRAAVELPLLRKDFVLDELQLLEARAAGADAVLLIVRALPGGELDELFGRAVELGLDVLVEVHDEAELARALRLAGAVIGVNNRDLRTFRTDLELSVRLAGLVPAERVLVAESGIRTAEDVRRLGAAGIDAVLVGESLMRQPDLRAAAAALTGEPKRAARGG